MTITGSPSLQQSGNKPVSLRVVDEIADKEGTSPLELEPLYDVVDPDALDALFQSDSAEGTFEFTYHGYHVVVREDGRLTVGEQDD